MINFTLEYENIYIQYVCIKIKIERNELIINYFAN